MLHTGSGPSTVQAFLATLNIPCPDVKTLKKRERESGSFVELEAKCACTEAIREERRLSGGLNFVPVLMPVGPSNVPEICLACKSDLPGVVLRSCQKCGSKYHHMCQVQDEQGRFCNACHSNTSRPEMPKGDKPGDTATPVVPLVTSSDTGWQKRGTGKNYNSLSGVGHIFGTQTKKVLAYSAKQKQCRICDVAKRIGQPVRMHDCCRNWCKSAKAICVWRM